MAVLTALLCSALMAFFISGTVISRAADDHARLAARDAGQLLIRIVNHDQAELTRISEDWAQWDDTFDYIGARDAGYVEKNLDDETLARNRFDLFALTDTDRNLVFSLGFSRRERRRIEPPADLVRLAMTIPVSIFESAEGGFAGIWTSGESRYLIGVEPVTPSLYDKPPNGALIVGRAIDDQLLREWEHMTGLAIREASEVEIASRDSPETERASADAIDSPDGIVGLVVIPGTLNTAVEGFVVQSRSAADTRPNLDVLTVLVLLVGSGLLIALVATTSIGRILVQRLEALHRFVAEVRRSGSFDQRIAMHGNDEISELAAAFNAFLDRIGADLLRVQSGADALRDSLRMIDDIIQNMPVGIVQWRYLREGERLALIDANPVAEVLTGLRSKERAGEEFGDLFPKAADAGVKELFLDVMRGGTPVDVDEFAIPGLRSDRSFHIYAFALPQDRLCVVIEDITHRRDAERERAKLEEQLRQSQKMEAVGRLAGGVAHDFNNILTTIRGYSELLLETTAHSDPSHEDLSEIRDAADRAAQLTAQLLAFSRRQVYSPRDIEINDLLLRSSKMLRRLIGEDIELATRVAGTDLHLRADPTQIEQILVNLVVNARDAIGTSGKIRIEVDGRFVDEDFEATHADAKAGDYVVISVSDNGAGMTADVRSQIFEPFFTTKERGKGTGLGLSTVYGIVRQNRGFLVVESTHGEGSTFHVHLPRVVEGGAGGGGDAGSTPRVS
ncbi:MAG: HAMP domain-containing protein [Deltaproteobacteria bacterium]|nr:HAMP domain-containing protein [Deltaproteobacteria bacterium]